MKKLCTKIQTSQLAPVIIVFSSQDQYSNFMDYYFAHIRIHNLSDFQKRLLCLAMEKFGSQFAVSSPLEGCMKSTCDGNKF